MSQEQPIDNNIKTLKLIDSLREVVTTQQQIIDIQRKMLNNLDTRITIVENQLRRVSRC